MMVFASCFRRQTSVVALACALTACGGGQPFQNDQADDLSLEGEQLGLRWQRSAEGWQLHGVVFKEQGVEVPMGTPLGEYTLLYSEQLPDTTPIPVAWPGGDAFPEKEHIYVAPPWQDATTPVAMNRAGEAMSFYPQFAQQMEDDTITFRHASDRAELIAHWQLDPDHPGDVQVSMTLTALQAGYFSIASPTLSYVAEQNLAWATVPGVFSGNRISTDLVSAYGYGQGLPDQPVLTRERTTSTLAPMVTQQAGGTLAVIAEPGTAADPWAEDHAVRSEWRLGLSHMNRRGQLSGTLYHPVLGQVDSKMSAGDTRTFRFRYSLAKTDWYGMLKHVAYDVYGLEKFLDLKQASRSLSSRLHQMRSYVTDAKTSLWRTERLNDREIGAQAYYGAVVGSDSDAMKNSDYGAMWMVAAQTGDSVLLEQRLPYARNFKLEQQQLAPGFFQGAALGQYYLSKAGRFTEEWGGYIEPVAATYYVLSDLGNMSIFRPDDVELRERIRLGADRLLAWQRSDGNWPVAFDHASQKEVYSDLTDYRPTFYGLIIAHRVLGDDKYLQGAVKAADWLLANAVEPLRFLGVCGDTRFAPDFATGQIAQALLDLYEVTGEEKYRDAGVKTTRFYATSIYTHPLASDQKKSHEGRALYDWQLNQTGLSFEHGGTIGSANKWGPILLASHAGLFIRVHQLTGDPLLRDLARAGVLARSDAFVDPDTGVASYYWKRMNAGPGPFPHHAWWQIGWITDYLMSEAALRSDNQVWFPRGFFTPKVGPHAAYGFAPGKVYGTSVELSWGEAGIKQPEVDSLFASAVDDSATYIVLLNGSNKEILSSLVPSEIKFGQNSDGSWGEASLINDKGQRSKLAGSADNWEVVLPAYGMAVIELSHH